MEEPRVPDNGRVPRILPWVITAVAVLVAAIAIGALVANESSQPKPLAQLTPQGRPDQGSIPVDDETAVAWGVTVADFVSYGSYGELQIWSTTKPEAKRCLAVVAEHHISVFNCTAPSLDTIANSTETPPGSHGRRPVSRRQISGSSSTMMSSTCTWPRILRAGSTDTSRATTPELGTHACPG